jgi:hypothetical protein
LFADHPQLWHRVTRCPARVEELLDRGDGELVDPLIPETWPQVQLDRGPYFDTDVGRSAGSTTCVIQ